MRTDPELFASAIEPYKEDLAVAVECVFVWYWIADLCSELGVTFVLGHALYRKAICDPSRELTQGRQRN